MEGRFDFRIICGGLQVKSIRTSNGTRSTSIGAHLLLTIALRVSLEANERIFQLNQV